MVKTVCEVRAESGIGTNSIDRCSITQQMPRRDENGDVFHHIMTKKSLDSGDSGVTEREARRVLARAMVALGRAQDPRDVLNHHENDIFAALRVLGGNHPLARALGIKPRVIG